jgi:hypothetical protein
MIRFIAGILIAAFALCAPQANARSAKQSFEHYQKIAQVGQIPGWPPLQPQVSGSCVPSTAATNFLARTSGLSTPETNATCFLINDLVTAGAITGNLTGARGCGTVLENLYFLATNNKTTAYLNLCGTSFGLTETATVTCTVDVGCAGDGVGAFLDTGWAASSNCANCSLSSIALGAYIQSTVAVSTTVAMGASGGAFTYFVPVQTGNLFWETNGNTFPSFANTNPQGAWAFSKTAANLSNAYLNAATTKASAVADTDAALPSSDMVLFAVGGGGNFSNYQISCAFVAAGVTSTMAFAINNACNHAMTVLGHNVY